MDMKYEVILLASEEKYLCFRWLGFNEAFVKVPGIGLTIDTKLLNVNRTKYEKEPAWIGAIKVRKTLNTFMEKQGYITSQIIWDEINKEANK